MRVLLLGGTGHIGHYLTQYFVRDGAEVIVVARGQTPTANPDGQDTRAAFWDQVRLIPLDRAEAERRVSNNGETEWQTMLRSVNADLVIDLIAYQAESVRQTIEAIRGMARHYIVIGSGWRFWRATHAADARRRSRKSAKRLWPREASDVGIAAT